MLLREVACAEECGGAVVAKPQTGNGCVAAIGEQVVISDDFENVPGLELVFDDMVIVEKDERLRLGGGTAAFVSERFLHVQRIMRKRWIERATVRTFETEKSAAAGAFKCKMKSGLCKVAEIYSAIRLKGGL